MSLRRIALVIYAVCIQQVWLEDSHTTGYVGKSVVLKSGADPSWTLTRVQWSIYDNTTYIASLRNGKTHTDRFLRHKGRLELNKKSGDLTIKNLKMDDSMTYTVELLTSNTIRNENKVHLQVQERLKKPNVHQVFNSLKDGWCHILLKCNLSDENVQFSWTPSEGIDEFNILGNTNLTFLWSSFSVNKNITFNCTASSGQQSETQQITVGCTEETKMAKACSSCSCASMVVLGIICTAMVFVLLYACKGKLKATCPEGPLHVYQGLFKC